MTVTLDQAIERIFGKPHWLANQPAEYPEPPRVHVVCPHCKRSVDSVGLKWQCLEHGAVAPIRSAVVNYRGYEPDWSAA